MLTNTNTFTNYRKHMKFAILLICATVAQGGLLEITGSTHAVPALSSQAVAKVQSHLRGAVPPSARTKIIAKLQPVLDQAAQRFNTTFSFGFIDQRHGSINLSSHTQLPPDAMIPAGSVTKTWTAVAVLKLAEQGFLSLDEPAYIRVDPVLEKLNETTMAQLWPQKHPSTRQPLANMITVRELLQMRSGLHDYHDQEMLQLTLADPKGNVPPFTYLRSGNRTFGFIPGDSENENAVTEYSSNGFVLLGMLLLNATGAVDGVSNSSRDWQSFDPRAVFYPGASNNDSDLYPNTIFMGQGLCSSYKNDTGSQTISHQYAATRTQPPASASDTLDTVNATTDDKLAFLDMWRYSCANGFGMGNIASTGGDLAAFYYHLFHGGGGGGGGARAVKHNTMALSVESVNEMLAFKGELGDWCSSESRALTGSGCGYGLGLIGNQQVYRKASSRTSSSTRTRTLESTNQHTKATAAAKLHDPRTINFPSPTPGFSILLGHEGQDWGSGAPLCGYDSEHNFGICLLATTSGPGMNASESLATNQIASAWTACQMYSAALVAVAGVDAALLCGGADPGGAGVEGGSAGGTGTGAGTGTTMTWVDSVKIAAAGDVGNNDPNASATTETETEIAMASAVPSTVDIVYGVVHETAGAR